MRNRTVGPGLELSTYARPSRTPDPDLGVTVKRSFLLFSKDIFNISFNTFRTSWTTRRPRPSYRDQVDNCKAEVNGLKGRVLDLGTRNVILEAKVGMIPG